MKAPNPSFVRPTPMVQPLSVGSVPTNRGLREHIVADCHFAPRNGPAWAICQCGERMDVEHGDGKPSYSSANPRSGKGSLAEAFEGHRRLAGLPPVSYTSRTDIAEWKAGNKHRGTRGRQVGAKDLTPRLRRPQIEGVLA